MAAASTFVLVARFSFRNGEPADTGAVLRRLAAADGCRRLSWARSTDDPDRFVLLAEFASAADYRRALGPMDARLLLIPFLTLADQATSGISEVLLSAVDGVVAEFEPTVVAFPLTPPAGHGG